MKIFLSPEKSYSELTDSFKNIEQFRDWYKSTSQSGGFGQIPLNDFSYFMEGLSAITLCRRGAYQLELLMGKAGYWYEISIAHGQDCYLSYMGGHVLMRYYESDIREWNPEYYVKEQSVSNVREESPSWSGEGASFKEGDNFQLSFGLSGGVILAYSYREEPYKSFLETVEIVTDNLGTSS